MSGVWNPDDPALERIRYSRRSEPCACGLVIVSASGSDIDVRSAVERHQRDPVHREWWRQQEGET